MTTLAFPPEYIELAVLGRVTRYTSRVDVYESDGTTIYRRGAGLVDGSVSIDMTRAERRTASLTLFDTDGKLQLNRTNGIWYDKVFKIYMGVVSPSGNWETCIGTFLFDTATTEDFKKDVQLGLRDFSKKLSYEIPLPVAFDINTPVETVVRDLALGGGLPSSRMNLPTTTSFLAEEKTINDGTVRFQAMYDLATAFGYDLYFDTAGVLQMVPFTDPATSQPQFTFRVGVDSNVASIKRSISDSLIYNHIVVQGEKVGGIPVWGEAFNQASTSPTSIDRIGIRTKPAVKNSWVVSNAQAQDVAEQILKYSSLEKYDCDLDVIIAPWLDVNITAEFQDPKATPGDPTRYLVNKIDLNLDLSPAKAHLSRVTNVIEAAPVYPASTVYPSGTVWPG